MVDDVIKCSNFDDSVEVSYSTTSDPWTDEALEIPLDKRKEEGQPITMIGIAIAILALFIVALVYFLTKFCNGE